MAEALGIASGVAGLISLGITLCEGVITYYTSYKDRNDSVARMYASVEMLNKTFALLNSAMNNKSLNLSIVAHVEEIVDSCSDGLKSLQKKLDKIKQNPNSKLAKVTYPLKESTLVKLIEISNDLRDNLALALNVLQIDATNLTHQKLDTLTGEVFAVSHGMDTLVLYQQDERTKKIYEWLSPLAGDFEKKQLDMINLPARQEDTGNWLVNTSAFDVWLKNSGKMLLCLGSPGIGKTVLASYIVHFLQQKSLQESSKFGIAYIYCNYKEAERQTLINLLSDLLRQLAAQRPSFDSELEILYENHNSKKTRPTIIELIRLLSAVVEKYTRVFIVIDALDEFFYEHQNDLIAEMLRVKPSVNLLITSRDILNVEFDPQDMCRLEIQAENEAITKYLEESITSSTRLKGHIKKQPSLKEKITKTIVEKAQNMFLLAHLHLKSLETRRSLRDVESALDTLPLSLDNVYDEAIERMSSQNSDDATLARKIISWIFYAFRPLNVRELQQALAVRPGDESFNPNGIIDREDLLSVCAGIVSIQQESDTIGLVHYTTQEYIQRKGEKNFLDSREARTEIAQTCLTFLTFREFGRGIDLGEKKPEDLDPENPLYYYASNYWADHAQGDPEQDIVELMSRLYTHETMIAIFAPLASIMRYYSHSRLGQTPLLHIAAASGLTKWVKMLLQAGADINAKDTIEYRQETALHTAVRTGRSTTAQILIDRGADTEAADEFRYTPLLRAAQKGSEDLIQPLLDTKADPFSKSILHETALHLAVESGNVAVVMIFLNLGLDIEAKNRSGNTALSLSALECHEPVMRLLLEMSANIEVRNIWNETPLQLAARGGYVPTTKLLLENGANIEAKNNKGATALFHANNRPLIRLLSEKGANIEARNERGETALLEAVQEGVSLKSRFLLENGANVEARNSEGATALFLASTEHLIRLLLKNGANIETKNDTGQTPLLKAVRLKNKPVIRLLLDKGASIEAGNNRGETPILKAAGLRDESVVQLLLEKGANIGAKNNEGETALFVAAFQGDASILRLLLEKGINIKQKCNIGRTALFNAAFGGECEAVKLLLEKGLNVNNEDQDGRTPLHVASLDDQVDVMKLLLKTGADLTAKDKYGKTALYDAAYWGRSKAVKLLLENGADVEGTNLKGTTALQAAAYSTHLETIQLLLKNGANPEVEDVDGLTALDYAIKGKEVDEEVEDVDGLTALDYAIKGKEEGWRGYEIEDEVDEDDYSDYSDIYNDGYEEEYEKVINLLNTAVSDS